MNNVLTVEDIYPALRELICGLRNAGVDRYAAILTHRMTKVAWTSRDELFEELVRVLSEVEATQRSVMPVLLYDQVRLLVKKLSEYVDG